MNFSLFQLDRIGFSLTTSVTTTTNKQLTQSTHLSFLKLGLAWGLIWAIISFFLWDSKWVTIYKKNIFIFLIEGTALAASALEPCLRSVSAALVAGPSSMYTVHCALCTVYCALCIVHCVLCTVHCALRTMYCVLCTCIVYCVLCNVHSTLCTVHCALCTVRLTLYPGPCALCTARLSLYPLDFALKYEVAKSLKKNWGSPKHPLRSHH